MQLREVKSDTQTWPHQHQIISACRDQRARPDEHDRHTSRKKTSILYLRTK